MTTIDSQHMRVFCAIAKHLNMSRAAHELGMTPSGISHCLKALEAELGVRLFERSSRRTSLTPAGVEFRTEAEAIIERMNGVRTKLRSLSDSRAGSLRIAACTTASVYILPLALREFRESFPEFTVRIHPCTAHQAVELLGDEEVDLALFIEPHHSGSTHFVPLAEDDLHFLVHPMHPWTRRGVDRDVSRENLILPERSSETYALIESYFQHEGIRFKPFIQIGNEEAIKQFVRLNLGIGLLPRWIAVDELENGTLACVPMGRRRLRRRWGILHCTSYELTFAESVFVNLCRKVFEARMSAPGS